MSRSRNDKGRACAKWSAAEDQLLRDIYPDYRALEKRLSGRTLSATKHRVHEARERWGGTSFLRIDPDERFVEPRPEGVWVRSWILVVHASLGHVDPDLRARYEEALTRLPDLPRRAFVAHVQEKFQYGEIAKRF